MKTQHEIFASCRAQNSFRGWPSRTACAIVIGLAMNACTIDQAPGDSASAVPSRIDLAPVLALAVAELGHGEDSARECNAAKKLLVACIFI